MSATILNFHSVSLSILERIIIDNRAYIMLALVFLLLSFYIWNCLIICKCYILGTVKGQRNSVLNFHYISLSSMHALRQILERIIIDRTYILLALVFLLLSFYIWNYLIICKC